MELETKVVVVVRVVVRVVVQVVVQVEDTVQPVDDIVARGL